jgi:hypothetical protein
MTIPISASHALTLNAVEASRELRVCLSAFICVHLWLILMDQAILAAQPLCALAKKYRSIRASSSSYKEEAVTTRT